MDYGEIGLKRSTVMCVLRNENKFLLLKRGKYPHIGKYIPIGGKIDPFETPDDAVQREVFEEAGITINNVKLNGILVETSPTKFNWINFIYTTEVDYFEPKECNEGTLEWIDIPNLAKIPTPTTDIYIYDYIAKNNFFIFDAIYDAEIELQVLKERISDKIIYRI
jgi:8-oxo-dGTP diphosphatase